MDLTRRLPRRAPASPIQTSSLQAQDDLRLSWWWDLRSVGFGQYASWSDDDISTVVTITITTYYQVWLSASGTCVYRRERGKYRRGANIVIPVVLAVGAFAVAGLAVGAAKLVLWLPNRRRL